ncbi:MAG: universal stress protein [Acidobacteriia bacterium]|nr:universal stress protein [Terriglobia bacterium]
MATSAPKNLKHRIALKNILLATDFAVSANRALPFALSLADHYGAKLYAAHVIPAEVSVLARPESIERILRETRDYAEYKLSQLAAPIQSRGGACEVLVGEGDVSQVLAQFVQQCAVDLVVVGTTSRTGLGKVLLGSIAEEIIREMPRPVLAVGPRALVEASGFQRVVYATDFSPGSLRAADYAFSLAREYQAHLAVLHVVEGVLGNSPHLALQLSEQRLRELIPLDTDLPCEPEVIVEIGLAEKRILGIAAELSADLIVMGVRGAGAFAQAASHFGSIAHTVVSLAECPVLTVGDGQKPEND